MWKTNELGIATWQANGGSWALDARGGSFGINVADQRDGCRIDLEAVEQDLLPVADEQFVRGRSWHVNFPQGDCSYALRLVLTPIANTAERLVLETTVAIQTSLLDTHPKLDIVAKGNVQAIDCATTSPDSTTISGIEQTGGSPPISRCDGENRSVAVLLAPYDSPFTTDQSSDVELRLRLSGDFLEKGVIRKARPWIILDSGHTPPSEQELGSLWSQLQSRPLPLTA